MPEDHPLRKLRAVVDVLLRTLDADFAARYAKTGRASIPPERLLRASWLPVLYSVRSERQRVEQIEFNLLYRWFVGLTLDAVVWDHSTFDPEARLHKKSAGDQSPLGLMGHALMENRQGLVVDAEVTHANGTAEREAAKVIIARTVTRAGATVGADQAYDVPAFVADLRQLGVTPQVAQKTKGSALDGRTTRHAGYRTRLKLRKRIEAVFGWAKTVGGLRKTRFRGLAKVRAQTRVHLRRLPLDADGHAVRLARVDRLGIGAPADRQKAGNGPQRTGSRRLEWGVQGSRGRRAKIERPQRDQKPKACARISTPC